MTPALVAGITALSLNYGAYLTEIFRAGILAVPRGQREAAQAVVDAFIGDRAVALESLKPEQILDPLKLIHGGTALQKGIDLRFRAHHGVLVTDRVLAARIVGNLLVNALFWAAGREPQPASGG